MVGFTSPSPPTCLSSAPRHTQAHRFPDDKLRRRRAVSRLGQVAFDVIEQQSDGSASSLSKCCSTVVRLSQRAIATLS